MGEAAEVAGVAGRDWTDEQRRAIERRTGDLLLDAAAGSGKTSVLVERFVRSVMRDGVEVGAILTITFTEKAAAELRDRIRARLRELGADDAARRTEGAFISTIHGFCARILRSHALAAGLDPRFAVLDQYASGPLASAAFDAALEQLARDADGAIDLIAAYGAASLRAAILSVYDQLRSAGQPEPRLPPVVVPESDGREELRGAAAVVAAELGAIADPSPRVADALTRVQRAHELSDTPFGARDDEDVWPADLGRLALPRNGAALCTDACAAYGAALAAVRAASGARAAVPVRDLLDRLLAGYGAEYAARKRRVSGLDFEDLELRTRALLADDDALRVRYAERFAAIMVDELQDTNRVQLELIESITRDNLFTVGDAQQSIYGFRHADVDLFRARGQRLQAVGARETLSTNFRSRPEIIDALNPTFAGVMGESFTPLRAGRAPAGAPEPAVELILCDKGADWALEGIASPWRLAEARALADRVAALVDDGAAPGEIVVLMRATTDMRAYERALETRGLPTYVIGGRGYWSHPQVVDMISYLRALANPRDEESLYGVLVSPLVGVSLDGLVILAAGARASERDPWTALREPPDGLAQDDRARLSAFAGWFAGQRARAARAGTEDLIDAALEATGYDLAMLAMPGGTRRLANVRKLMRLGREHEEAHGPDLRGFLALIDDREAGRSPELREGEAPVEGDGLNAIRLMTIHRAKGLEFPIVCVADLGRSPRPPAEILRVDREGRLGLRLARAGAGGRESALDYKPIGDDRRAAEEREERRLFYVAMTRARERLVLSGAAKFDGWLGGRSDGGGPVAWIAPALVSDLGDVITAGGGDVGGVTVRIGVPDAPGPAAAPGPGTEGAPAASADADAAEAGSQPAAGRPPVPAPPPLQAPPPQAAPPPMRTLSYSSLEEYARCGYRFYAERVLGLPEVASSPAHAPARDAAAAPFGARGRGVLAHALLERLDFRRPVVPPTDVVAAAAARAGLWPAPGPEELDGLVALVRGFAASELCARLGRATNARREERFAFPLSDDPAHPLVVGTFDVLARESDPAHPGRMLVVDYKSDRLESAIPADIVAHGYATQRLVYALAALRAGAREVEVAHCFLEHPDEPVVATFPAAAAADLQAELRALAAGVLAGRFEVSPAPHRGLCAGCPAEGGLCSWPTSQTRREAADRLF